ncbi:MAG: DUF1318 domain-containing protein [Gammaproteobacteria bacterium]
MKKLKIPVLSSILLFMTACVTINVYFPAAEAEDAAEKIINKIIGDENSEETQGNNPQSHRFDLNPLNWIISSAHAEVNINISSPAIVEITDRMKQRFDESLQAYLDTAIIGFTNEGFIDILATDSLGLKDRQQLKKLVADENRDRKALYRELAVANGHADWEEEITNVFIRLWKEKAHSGWKYQDAEGVWQTK